MIVELISMLGRRTRRALVGFWSISIGCTPFVRLVPHDDQSFEQAHSAPIVVVGVTGSDEPIGLPQPSRRDPNYPMQLHCVKVQIENVLRGELSDRNVHVYYFALGAGFDGPRPLGFALSSRRILWLRRESGVIRTACDGWDECTAFVESGSHIGYKPDPQKPIEYAIADIQLTRGEGKINDDKFARSLMPSYSIPDDYRVAQIERLALTEHGPVEAAACAQLRTYSQDQMSDPRIRRAATLACEKALCPEPPGPR